MSLNKEIFVAASFSR